ncbi:hypothetical protein L7F22_025121 [Adiantum nelumboides]|nr:hypothetical protein [Adiantum nelumboides]
MPDAPKKQNCDSILANEVPALLDSDEKPAEPERSMLDIGQVEEILKQKTWSRDQVNRLTEILQKQVSDTDKANLSVEGKKMQEQFTVETKIASPIQVAQAYMGEQTARPSGLAAIVHGSVFLSSQGQHSPGRTLVEDRYPASPFSRGWPRGSAPVRIPKRSLAIDDEIIATGPVRRVRQKTSMLASPSPYSYSRRVTGLSKPLETCMSSPPSQSSQTAMKILETLEKLSPSPQGKLLTEKSANGLRLLDKFSPHKGKISDDTVCVAAVGANERTPQISVVREKIVTQNPSGVLHQKSAEPQVSGRSTLGGNFVEAKVKESLLIPSSLPDSRNSSILNKGFRMNAVFEETNSDEEAKSHAKQLPSSVTRYQAAFPKEGALMTPASTTVVFSKADGSTPSTLSSAEVVQGLSSPSASLVSIKSSSPITLPHFSAQDLNNNFFPSSSFALSSAMATQSKQSDAAVTTTTATPVSLAEQRGLTESNTTIREPVTPFILPNPDDAAELTVISSSFVTSASPESMVTALPKSSLVDFGSSGNAPKSSVGFSFSGSSTVDGSVVSLTRQSNYINTFHSDSMVNMATESPVTDKQAEGDTKATENLAEEAEITMVLSPVVSVPKISFGSSSQPSTASAFLFGAGTSGTLLSASAFSVGAGSGTGSAGASAMSFSSTFAFGAQSFTTIAPTSFGGPSASVPSATSTFGGQSSTGVSTSLSSSASPFAFGALSGTTPTGQGTNSPVMSIFGVSTSAASSNSVFAFGAQSGTALTGQDPNLALKPIFGPSSANSSGQTLFPEALPSLVANPFQSSAESSSAFIFGSSNAAPFGLTSAPSSVPSAFTSGSLALPSFAGASSTFSFGAHAMTSPVMSGPAASSTMSSFPALSFSTPTASVTPNFSFGAAAAASCTAASSATQPFAFGAPQRNPLMANPFSSSGTQNNPFSFGATAMLPAPSSFSSASSSSSNSLYGSNASSSVSSVFAYNAASLSSPSLFAFGSGLPAMSQTPASMPFAFGNQPAAVAPNNGQPFAFTGGQPAASTPAPNPSPAVGTAQSGLGFSLGATGGDKSGRKFIKAKRIGNVKKGREAKALQEERRRIKSEQKSQEVDLTSQSPKEPREKETVDITGHLEHVKKLQREKHLEEQRAAALVREKIKENLKRTAEQAILESQEGEPKKQHREEDEEILDIQMNPTPPSPSTTLLAVPPSSPKSTPTDPKSSQQQPSGEETSEQAQE